MSLAKFSEVLTNLGCSVEIDDRTLLIDIDDKKVFLEVDDVWIKSINHFYRAKQYSFNPDIMVLTSNNFVEFQIV
jgi:hypothetical protein